MDVTIPADLYRHMEWADATVWSAVLACEPAQSDARLRGLLYHSHLVQHAFLRTWRGQPRDLPFPSFEELAGLMRWAQTYHDEVVGQFDTFTPAALGQPMPLAWADLVEPMIGRPPAVTTLAETVLQVPLHTHYHRGQVNVRLRELGSTPPLVDYIAWLWFGRPRAAWPTAAPPAPADH